MNSEERLTMNDEEVRNMNEDYGRLEREQKQKYEAGLKYQWPYQQGMAVQQTCDERSTQPYEGDRRTVDLWIGEQRSYWHELLEQSRESLRLSQDIHRKWTEEFNRELHRVKPAPFVGTEPYNELFAEKKPDQAAQSHIKYDYDVRISRDTLRALYDALREAADKRDWAGARFVAHELASYLAYYSAQGILQYPKP